MTDKNNESMKNNVPEDSIKSFARRLLPEIQKFYATEEGRKLFEQWKKEQADTKQK